VHRLLLQAGLLVVLALMEGWGFSAINYSEAQFKEI
jgi:hypothetical protein